MLTGKILAGAGLLTAGGFLFRRQRIIDKIAGTAISIKDLDLSTNRNVLLHLDLKKHVDLDITQYKFYEVINGTASHIFGVAFPPIMYFPIRFGAEITEVDRTILNTVAIKDIGIHISINDNVKVSLEDFTCKTRWLSHRGYVQILKSLNLNHTDYRITQPSIGVTRRRPENIYIHGSLKDGKLDAKIITDKLNVMSRIMYENNV